ncbi:MAG: EamA family transporter [Candidatus Omnitrophica bacterium]|nr:EamA family transporter [Candidatus Omnitrophota bacterium]
MFKKKITFRLLLLLIASDILETSIHFFFKKSALTQSGFEVTGLASALIFLKAIFFSWFLWVGLFIVVMVFIIWSTILTRIDLSVAVPVASFSYILVPIASIIFLHEKVTFFRWIGILLILGGVILVSLSSKERIVHNK